MRMNRLAEWFARSRAPLAGAALVFTALAIFGLTRVGFDDRPMNIFRSSQDEFALLEDQVFADFGSDDNDCLVVVESEQLFSPRGVTLLRELIAELRQLDGIQQVRSLDDVVVFSDAGGPRSLLPPADADAEAFDNARVRALAHPLIGGQLLSPDGQTALVIARLAGESLAISEVQPVVEDIHELIARTAPQEDWARVRLTGVPPIRYEIFSAIRRDSQLFMIVGAALSFVMATVIFRRISPVLIVSIPPVLAAVWTVGLLGLLGIPFNVINTILPMLVMIVGFTDSVHLMYDIRRSVARGLTPLEAAMSAIEHLGIACALTSFTTAVGFGSLMVAGAEVIQKLGLTAAMGAALAFLSTMTLVPLLASTRLGHHVARGSAGHQNVNPAARSSVLHRLGQSIVEALLDHRRLVAAGGLALTVLITITALQLKPDNHLTESIPGTNESVQALQHCDAAFGGALMIYVLVDWDEELSLGADEVQGAMADVQQLLADTPGTNHPLSILNLLQALPDPSDDLAARIPLLNLAPPDLVRRFVHFDHRRGVVTAHVKDEGTRAHEPMFRKIEGELLKIEEQHQGVQLRLTGTVVVASRSIDQMIVDLANSLGLATIVIFVTMSIVFRSLRLGLLSLLPNVFPMVATAAWLVITGRPLQLTSVIVFSICLGVAVDDTIHFINRFQRELPVDGVVAAAIRRTFVAVGSALMTTTVVLVVGFGSVWLSEMPPSRLFAELGTAAIIAALVGDLLILPALLACFVRGKEQVPVTDATGPSEAHHTENAPAVASETVEPPAA